MSTGPEVERALRAYYTRYYRDTLGIPDWEALVRARLDDAGAEGRRLARLEEALGRPVGGLRLLNVGCGAGGFNAVAERAGARAWGVDPDADALAIARRRVPDGRLARAVAEALPFAAATFDVVYCYSTLEHVQDAGRAVAEMLRVLGAGGALYLHLPHRWAWREGHYKVFWVPGLRGWAARAYLAARGRPAGFLATLRPLTLGECRRYVEAAGGRVARVLDGGAARPAGGPLWPLVRGYYRLSGIRPQIELVARRAVVAEREVHGTHHRA